MITWEEAYSNTTKIPFGVGKNIVCKKCNEVTPTKVTEQKQIIGNCYQWIAKCEKCNSHFVDEN